MTTHIACDIEADNLLYGATKIHCICTQTEEEEQTFYDVGSALSYLEGFDCVVFHGGKTYDEPLLMKLHGWSHPCTQDTHLLSRMDEPDRRGGHSIEAWGVRWGVEKEGKDITDWSELTPEMEARCVSDALICWMTWNHLRSRMGL